MLICCCTLYYAWLPGTDVCQQEGLLTAHLQLCAPQAAMAMANPEVQPPPTLLHLRRTAVDSFSTAVRLAAAAGSCGTAEKAARLLWNAAGTLLQAPALQCMLVAPLRAAVDALITLQPPDVHFQVRWQLAAGTHMFRGAGQAGMCGIIWQKRT